MNSARILFSLLEKSCSQFVYLPFVHVNLSYPFWLNGEHFGIISICLWTPVVSVVSAMSIQWGWFMNVVFHVFLAKTASSTSSHWLKRLKIVSIYYSFVGHFLWIKSKVIFTCNIYSLEHWRNANEVDSSPCECSFGRISNFHRK